MEISCPETTPAGRRKAIEELREGFKLAKQLEILIGKSSSGDKEEKSMYSSSGDLLERISNSFSYAISVLNDVEFSEVNQSAGRRLEDSEGSSKSTTPVKNRRGCYKRRRSEDTRSTDTPNWVEDGYAWRKYGQKVIHNCKYPRNYYRCTNKSDGCPATKQVQQIGDDPPIYRTTYSGKHTCQNLLKPSRIVVEDDYDADSSLILNFDSSNLKNKQQDFNALFSSSYSSLSIKEEHNKCLAVQSDLIQNQPSSSDYLFSPDELTAFGSSLSSDHADVISCTDHNFDIGRFEDDLLKQYGFES